MPSKYVVSRINQYGYDVELIYEGFDQEEAIKAYYRSIGRFGAGIYRITEHVYSGFRTFRLYHPELNTLGDTSEVHSGQLQLI